MSVTQCFLLGWYTGIVYCVIKSTNNRTLVVCVILWPIWAVAALMLFVLGFFHSYPLPDDRDHPDSY